MNDLHEIFVRHGTDKAQHGYARVYEGASSF
jgi:hypothetical protein